MRRGGRGRDGGNKRNVGGRGGKGSRPQFTRVIPKFLQKYESMLTGGPRADPCLGEEVFSVGGEPTGGAKSDGGSTSGSRSSSVPGGETSNPLAQARRAGSGGNSGGAFEDYDEEEVAALEAYMKTHPTKEEDREALWKRAKELSASIGAGVQAQNAVHGKKLEMKESGAEAGGGEGKGDHRESPSEEPLEYTDASGKLKFNKRPVGPSEDSGKAGTKDKKKTKRAKLAKLNNAKLLSFGDDDEE